MFRQQSIFTKWLIGFLTVICVLILLVFLQHIKLFQFLLGADKQFVLDNYPRFGIAFYYFFRGFFMLKTVAEVLSVLLFSILLFALIRSKQRTAGNSAAHRQYLFWLLATFLFLIPLATLVYLLIKTEAGSENKGMEINIAINKRNNEYAARNSLGFTDRERELTKPKGVFRIGVIGDSFVYGDGIPYEKAWSHKLEQKLLADYDSVEVLHWGKNGWSTLDEFNFFKKQGRNYGIDLLIIGWVDNDPDLSKWKAVNAVEAKKMYPLIYCISPALAQNMATNYEWENYHKWIDSLYTPQNLSDYGQLLTEFDRYLDTQNVKSLVVMTPGPYEHNPDARFNLVEPLLKNANFSYLNLYPAFKRDLYKYTPAQLSANAVNAHPGEIMTEEFAKEVKNYLEQNNYLKGIPKRR
jgi:hypothetical protein